MLLNGGAPHLIDPASTTQSSLLSGASITTVSQAQAGLTDTALDYNAVGCPEHRADQHHHLPLPPAGQQRVDRRAGREPRARGR